MKLGFLKKKKQRPFLVLDIGTEAVKSLVCKKENNEIVVLSSSLEYFEPYGVFDGKDFEKELIKKTVSKIIKKNYKDYPVLINLAPNVLRARIVWQLSQQEKDLKISRGRKKFILDQVLEKAKQKISYNFSKEFGILAKDIKWISLKVIETRINGYLVSDIQGCQGKNLDFKVLAVFLPKHYFQIINEVFRDLKVRSPRIVHLAESLLLGIKEKEGIFIDIGGETSQIFLVKQGVLEKIEEFNLGAKIFSQKISQSLGIDQDSARILKEKYSNKFLTGEVRKRIQEMLLNEKDLWYSNFQKKVEKRNLPIFIFGGGSLLPEVQEVLPGAKLLCFKKIKNSQYTLALLISYYGQKIF